jgi:hypothetical protein
MRHGYPDVNALFTGKNTLNPDSYYPSNMKLKIMKTNTTNTTRKSGASSPRPLTSLRLAFLALIIAAGFSSCYVSHPYGARWVPGHYVPGYYHEHWVPGHWA